MTAIDATVMNEITNLVAEYGTPHMSTNHDHAFIYAETNPDPKSSYSSGYTGGFDRKRVKKIVAYAKKLNFKIHYVKNYYNGYTQQHFNAFVFVWL